jgi:hypothetical protein
MPRPPNLDPEQLARRKAECEADAREHFPAALVPTVVELGIAGGWLTEQLVDAGASEDECHAVAMALGQMAFPRRDPWVIAEKLLGDFKAGRVERPGRELARRLLDGEVPDLGPGGAFIVEGPEGPELEVK